MILWVSIETFIIFIICWFLIFDYLKRKMNSLLSVKENMLFANLNIDKIIIHDKMIIHTYHVKSKKDYLQILNGIKQLKSTSDNIYVNIHATMYNNKVNIIEIPINILENILNAKKYIITTQICIYGKFTIHTGYKFIAMTTMN